MDMYFKKETAKITGVINEGLADYPVQINIKDSKTEDLVTPGKMKDPEIEDPLILGKIKGSEIEDPSTAIKIEDPESYSNQKIW